MFCWWDGGPHSQQMRFNYVENVVSVVFKGAESMLMGAGVRVAREAEHSQRRVPSRIVIQKARSACRCKDIGRQTCKFLITSGSSNAAPALDERALPLPEANLADAAWWAAWPEKREVRAEMVLGAGGDLQFCSIGLPDPSDKYLDRLMSTPE